MYKKNKKNAEELNILNIPLKWQDLRWLPGGMLYRKKIQKYIFVFNYYWQQ